MHLFLNIALNEADSVSLQPGMYLNVTGFGSIKVYIFVHNADQVCLPKTDKDKNRS